MVTCNKKSVKISQWISGLIKVKLDSLFHCLRIFNTVIFIVNLKVGKVQTAFNKFILYLINSSGNTILFYKQLPKNIQGKADTGVLSIFVILHLMSQMYTMMNMPEKGKERNCFKNKVEISDLNIGKSLSNIELGEKWHTQHFAISHSTLNLRCYCFM